MDGEFLLLGRFHDFQLKFSNGVINNIIGKEKEKRDESFQITFNDIGELSSVKKYYSYSKILRDSISFNSSGEGF